MTILVHFAIHRFTTDVEEIDEQGLARLIGDDAEFVASLCAFDGLEGALVIDDAAIVDDIGSAVQRLCFEALETLVMPGTTYQYPYFTSNTLAKLTSSVDGASIVLSGDDVPTRASFHAPSYSQHFTRAACVILRSSKNLAAAAAHQARPTSFTFGRSPTEPRQRLSRTAFTQGRQSRYRGCRRPADRHVLSDGRRDDHA